jgi:hypothetical protein
MNGTGTGAWRLIALSALLLVFQAALAQAPDSTGTPPPPSGPEVPQVHGNFSTDAQYYNTDSLIGALVPDEKMGINAWGNIQYSQGNFRAGIRFETYEPSLIGYPAGEPYNGSGIGYRFASYSIDDLDITVGNFFEQFGQGLAFRSYEERYGRGACEIQAP